MTHQEEREVVDTVVDYIRHHRGKGLLLDAVLYALMSMRQRQDALYFSVRCTFQGIVSTFAVIVAYDDDAEEQRGDDRGTRRMVVQTPMVIFWLLDRFGGNMEMSFSDSLLADVVNGEWEARTVVDYLMDRLWNEDVEGGDERSRREFRRLLVAAMGSQGSVHFGRVRGLDAYGDPLPAPIVKKRMRWRRSPVDKRTGLPSHIRSPVQRPSPSPSSPTLLPLPNLPTYKEVMSRRRRR